MRTGQPSQTARGAAAYRAIHQTHEGGVIFRDPFAVKILDEETRAALDQIVADPAQRLMRLFITTRSRFSEDALAASVARGVRQVVVLGAGLDTFSLRNPFVDEGVRVFEVDHPSTQARKRERLEQAGIALPASLTFAPVDFERQHLADGLANAGFDRNSSAFFQWLGVVPYLTPEAISATLDYIATIPASAVVFDYTEPFENHTPERRANLMATRGARGGAWRALAFFFQRGRTVRAAARQGICRRRRRRLCRAGRPFFARTGRGGSALAPAGMWCGQNGVNLAPPPQRNKVASWIRRAGSC